MERLTPAERADPYRTKPPGYPAVWSRQGLAAGCVERGNNYRGSGYTGSYPPGYLKRIAALFPGPGLVLHLFSRYTRANTFALIATSMRASV